MVLLRFRMYLYIYYQILGRVSLLLYVVQGPLTLMLSRKDIVTIRNKSLRILITTCTNYVIEFVISYNSIVIQRSLRGVIKAIMSLYLGTRTSQLYLEKKSINKVIVYLVNSLENLLTKRGRFVLYKVTELSFIIALISRYVLVSFLVTRNYRFRYSLL